MASASTLGVDKFGITLAELLALMGLRGIEAKKKIDTKYGGPDGLCRRLKTSPINGLQNDPNDLDMRKTTFGTNNIPTYSQKSLFSYIRGTLQNFIIKLLLYLTLANLALSLLSIFFLSEEDEEDEYSQNLIGLIESIICLCSLIIIILAIALCEYFNERWTRDLLQDKGCLEPPGTCTVLRCGLQTQIPNEELVVGDICIIKAGDKLPADGVFIDKGNDLLIDESHLTGMSSSVMKTVDMDPILLLGTLVLNGNGKMVIIAVGSGTQKGIAMVLTGTNVIKIDHKEKDIELIHEVTPLSDGFQGINREELADGALANSKKERSVLRAKIVRLITQYAWAGAFFFLCTFLILSFRFGVSNYLIEDNSFKPSDLQYFVKFMTLSLEVVLGLLLPEGLPLAIILSLAYSAKMMNAQNILVKSLNACEAIGNVTTLCIMEQIKDPVPQSVCDSIKKCQHAGITVQMVTSDTIDTARSIATTIGILNPCEDFIANESAEFNSKIRDEKEEFSTEIFNLIWPRLRVVASAQPKDKYNLVKCITDSKLAGKNELIAVIGNGIDDIPAVIRADVGIAKNVTGADVAIIASDIILTDDSFKGIVKAVMWSRNAYDSIAKFLQFQITFNVVAVLVAFVSICAIKNIPLNSVQWLWLNTILVYLASVALAIEPPDEDKFLNRKPYDRKSSIISQTMRWNIIGQAIYQTTILFTLIFAGDNFFGIGSGRWAPLLSPPTQHFTIVFNTFFLMTLFNLMNTRKIHAEHNIFAGLLSNPIFCVIWIVLLFAHIIVIEYGASWFHTADLTLEQWLWCLAFGLGTLLWQQIVTLYKSKSNLPK